MSKDEILEEIRILKTIFEIHSKNRLIKDPKEFEKHMDAVLDRVSELEKRLKELE